jgi:GntR family histidine utilization transcriptional repressor
MQKNDLRYLLVKQYILDGIGSGLWSAGDRVPSENELCDLCKVSRMTARRALEELHQTGILVRIKGRGSFVAEDKQQSSLLQIRSIAAEIKSKGLEHRARLLICEKQKSPLHIVKSLALKDGDLCGYSKILHYQNDRPIQLEERWVNLAVIPDYTEQDFNKITPSAYLNSVAPVTEAEHSVEAIIGEDFIRHLLDVDSHEAILLLERITYCNGQPVSYARLYHPGNRFRLGTRFKTRETPDKAGEDIFNTDKSKIN